MERRKDFEKKENRELALKIMMTVLNLFESSDEAEYTLTTTNLWNKIYRTLLDFWIDKFQKEFFERERITDKTLTFDAYKKAQSQFSRSLREAIKAKTSVKFDKSDKLKELSPKESKTIKIEYSRVSEPIMSALLSSNILTLEARDERKKRDYVEGEFLRQEQLKEQSYNFVKLNTNFSEIEKGLREL